MTNVRSLLAHPASRTLVVTVVAYGLILAVMTVLIFAIPYLAFRFL